MTAPPDRCDPTALSIIRLTPEEYRKAIAAAEARGLRMAADIAEAQAPATQDWTGTVIADACCAIADILRARAALIPAKENPDE